MKGFLIGALLAALMVWMTGAPADAAEPCFSDKVTIFPYGIATIAVDDCDTAELSWKGNRDVIIHVDGETFFPDGREIAISGIAPGSTLIIKHGGPGRFKVDVLIR